MSAFTGRAHRCAGRDARAAAGAARLVPWNRPSAGARAAQPGPRRRVRGDGHAFRGDADHPARRDGAEPPPHACALRMIVEDEARSRRWTRQVRDGTGRPHHHAADALARPRARGDGARDMARRARYSSRAELRGGLGIEDAPAAALDVYRFLPDELTRRHGAARLALRGDGLPAGALAVEHGAESARGDGSGGAPGRPVVLRTSIPGPATSHFARSAARLSGSAGESTPAEAGRQRSLPRDRRLRQSRIGDETFTWEKGDCVAVPPWHWSSTGTRRHRLRPVSSLHRRAGHTRPRPLARGNSLKSYASPASHQAPRRVQLRDGAEGRTRGVLPVRERAAEGGPTCNCVWSQMALIGALALVFGEAESPVPRKH